MLSPPEVQLLINAALNGPVFEARLCELLRKYLAITVEPDPDGPDDAVTVSLAWDHRVFTLIQLRRPPARTIHLYGGPDDPQP